MPGAPPDLFEDSPEAVSDGLDLVHTLLAGPVLVFITTVSFILIWGHV